MSEKLCLQWDNFKDNVLTSFTSLRAGNDFADVTLACEDGKQMEAHKVILAASSPFFQNLLKKNKHSHPLIFMRGVKSEVLLALLDFLYFGETNVFHNNLESFLAIAEELHIKGLMGTYNEENAPNELQQIHGVKKEQMPGVKKEIQNQEVSILKPSMNSKSNVGFSEELQDLDVKVNSMMERTQLKNIHGQPLYRCTMCGKEAKNGHMKKHIERYHLEGFSIPCNHCQHISKTRDALRNHERQHTGNNYQY